MCAKAPCRHPVPLRRPLAGPRRRLTYHPSMKRRGTSYRMISLKMVISNGILKRSSMILWMRKTLIVRLSMYYDVDSFDIGTNHWGSVSIGISGTADSHCTWEEGLAANHSNCKRSLIQHSANACRCLHMLKVAPGCHLHQRLSQAPESKDLESGFGPRINLSVIQGTPKAYVSVCTLCTPTKIYSNIASFILGWYLPVRDALAHGSSRSVFQVLVRGLKGTSSRIPTIARSQLYQTIIACH